VAPVGELGAAPGRGRLGGGLQGSFEEQSGGGCQRRAEPAELSPALRAVGRPAQIESTKLALIETTELSARRVLEIHQP
jgi:hypothetical protein